jgi:superfamily II DNA/RNA helicase
MTFHGGIGEERREAIKAAFNAAPSTHPLRILVATDAAREGVNLQNHCADLFHFDIPWNPSRMEQRNGRIDRKLQRSPVVRCHYFVVHQRAEDRQFAANQKHWAARLEALAVEIEQEPDRIRANYRVRAQRIEPVGLVYLWPVSG